MYFPTTHGCRPSCPVRPGRRGPPRLCLRGGRPPGPGAVSSRTPAPDRRGPYLSPGEAAGAASRSRAPAQGHPPLPPGSAPAGPAAAPAAAVVQVTPAARAAAIFVGPTGHRPPASQCPTAPAHPRLARAASFPGACVNPPPRLCRRHHGNAANWRDPASSQPCLALPLNQLQTTPPEYGVPSPHPAAHGDVDLTSAVWPLGSQQILPKELQVRGPARPRRQGKSLQGVRAGLAGQSRRLPAKGQRGSAAGSRHGSSFHSQPHPNCRTCTRTGASGLGLLALS